MLVRIADQHIVRDITGSLGVAKISPAILGRLREDFFDKCDFREDPQQDPLRWILDSALSITLIPAVLSYWAALCEMCYKSPWDVLCVTSMSLRHACAAGAAVAELLPPEVLNC